MQFRRMIWLPLVLGVLLGVGVSTPAAAEAMNPPVEVNQRTRPIEGKLICQCGCTMIVANCDCATADAMRGDIARKLDQGMSEPAILAAYVAQYGEKVVAYPERKGFNWVAWITPFAGLLAGGGLLYYILRKWVGRHAAADEEGPQAEEALSPEEKSRYDSRVQDILKKHF